MADRATSQKTKTCYNLRIFTLLQQTVASSLPFHLKDALNLSDVQEISSLKFTAPKIVHITRILLIGQHLLTPYINIRKILLYKAKARKVNRRKLKGAILLCPVVPLKLATCDGRQSSTIWVPIREADDRNQRLRSALLQKRSNNSYSLVQVEGPILSFNSLDRVCKRTNVVPLMGFLL